MINGSRALWRFCFTLLVLSAGVLAQEEENTTLGQSDCEDWSCRIEKALQQLSEQISKLTIFLIPHQPGENGSPTTTTGGYTTTSTPYTATSVPTPTIPEEPKDPSVLSPWYTYTPESKPVKHLSPHPGYRSVAYFGNWDIYARQYFPQMIPADRITHLLYSFANINNETGEVILTDPYADSQALYEGDEKDESNDLFGNLKQLNLLKKKYRNFKVLLSIGGYTYTHDDMNLDGPAASEEGRQTFADSCAQLITDYGFDGIDIDWEYPSNEEKGWQLVDLLNKTRNKMNEVAAGLADGSGYGYEPEFVLSIAAPAGKDNYQNFPLKDISDITDFINVMTYDYSGPWSQNAAHHSNLYPSPNCPTCTPLNTQEVIEAYLTAGVPSRKLNLGLPLYGRAFTDTQGLGQPFTSIENGSYSTDGTWDIKDLPWGSAEEYIDMEAGATYSYDNKSQTLVSYDTPEMSGMKVDWLKEKRLGGVMWWEVSQDRKDEDSVVIKEGLLIVFACNKTVKQLGGYHGRQLEVKANWLHYPNSQFENLSNGFEGFEDYSDDDNEEDTQDDENEYDEGDDDEEENWEE